MALEMSDVMGTIDALLAAGKKPAMWDRLTHLSGDILLEKQMEAVEGVAAALLEYANDNNISKQLWDDATKEAAVMNGYEWRYIHQGLMHEAIKTVKDRHKAQVQNTTFEDFGEVIQDIPSKHHDVLTTASKSGMFIGWIKRHRAAGIPPSPFGWNASEKQIQYMGNKLGVDVNSNGNNRTAVQMFLEDYNNMKNNKPYIPTKITVKDNEVVLFYE